MSIIKTFIWEVRNFGLKIALDSRLISFIKWFVKAKRIRISYWRKNG